MTDRLEQVDETTTPSNGEDDNSGESDSAAGALIRGLRILGCFDIDHPEWSLIEISRHMGYHKATTRRVVKMLEAEGFLAQNKESGKFCLGSNMLRGMYLLKSPAHVSKIARPHIEQLAAETGESVTLGVWNDHEVLFIDSVLTWRPFKPWPLKGVVFRDFANAHSKVFLAFGPKQRRRMALAEPIVKLTEYTIVDPALMAQELERVRREGVAYDLQEDMLGTCAVAAPIFDSTDEVIACLGVVAPTERFGPEVMKTFAQAVKRTAQAISRDMGYQEGTQG